MLQNQCGMIIGRPKMEIKDYFSPTYETIKRLTFPGREINDIMDEIIRDVNSQIQMCEMFGKSVPITYEPFKFCKINETEKETKKMEAKKCDRCGKLFEMPGACENPSGANVRFKFEKVYRAEEKSGTKIAEEQSKDIYIKYGLTSSDHYVDFCPDCRASLKKWFENPEKEGK